MPREMPELDKLAQHVQGAWKLVSVELELPDGGVYHPFGTTPVGQVMFWEVAVRSEEKRVEGRFAAQIMNADKTGFASEFPTADEAVAAYLGYVAYFGSFEMNEKDMAVDSSKKAEDGFGVTGVLINHVEASLNPNWLGGHQVRHFHFFEDRVILRPMTASKEETETPTVLEWVKIG